MEKTDLKRHLQIEEEVKKTVLIPCPREMRDLLFLSDEQFRTLLEVDSPTYWDLMSGSKQFSHNQKLFLYELIRLAKEKGIITDERY